MNKRVIIGTTILAGLILGFQECSPVSFSTVTPLPTVPMGANSGGNTQSLKTTQAVFAVRGMNCIACHGVINSSIVTDFGYGSPNFYPAWFNQAQYAPTFFESNNMYARTAFNDIQDTTGGGWDNMSATGPVYVPNVSIPQGEASILFGVNSAIALPSVLGLTNPQTGNTTMTSGVTGSPAVIGVSSVSISFPSQSEILNLAPGLSNPNFTAINVSGLPAGITPSSISGLEVDPATGKFIRNTPGQAMSCYGDVVINGILLLENTNLQTDADGCRLYVSQTVFVQGPITHAAGTNIQITSASAIVMGFSTLRMGALQGPPPSGDQSSVRIASQTDNSGNANWPPVGGPYARFSVDLDSQYSPGTAAGVSGSTVNGVDRTAFFDNIVSNALVIGAELQDAGDQAAINTASSGVNGPNEYVTTESDGKRVAINYAGILLNAPHIHSRYGGNFQGVIVAEVAYLARNPSSSQIIEQFSYDSTFSNVPVILPAISGILSVSP